MRAGKLRHLATIERPVRVVSGTGEESVSWETDFQAYIDIKGIRGVMVENAQQIAPESTHKITMQYLPSRTLNEANRVNYCGNVYDILFVDNVMMKGRVWELHVKQYRGAYGDQKGY